MADSSKVLVELRLLGAAAMNQGAKSAGRGLASLGASGKTAAAGLFATSAASDETVSAVDRVRLAAKATASGVVRLGSGLATAGGAVLAFGRKAGTVGAFALAAGLYAGTKATIQFDRAMANVNSIAQLTPGKLAAISKSVLAMGGKTAQQPLTLAQGLYDLVSSGFDATQSLRILKASAFAATAGLSDTATSTHAIVAVLNAYHLGASSAAHVSDLLFQTVNKAIITFPELAGSIGTVLPYAATLGVGLGQLGGAITSLTRQGLNPQLTMTAIRQILVSMLKPSRALTTEFSALGLTGEQLIKRQGLVGGLTTLVSLTNGSKAAVAALFPNVRALNGVFALTGKNAQSAAENVASFKDVHGATMKALAKQALSVSYQWGKLKSTATGLAITIGQTLVPSARKGLAALTGFLSPGAPGGSAVASFVAGVTSGSSTVVGGAHNQVFQAPVAQLAGARVRRGVTTGARQVSNFFGGLGGGGSGTPGKVGRDTASAVGSIASFTIGAFNTVRSVVTTTGPVIVKYAKQLVAAFMPAVPFFKNVLLPLVAGIGVGLGLTLSGLIPIIHLFADGLGLVGTILKPLKTYIALTGVALGLVFGGEVVKTIDGVLDLAGAVGGKLGVAFEVLRLPVRAAAFALDTLEFAVGKVIDGLSGFVGWLGDSLTWVSRFAGTMESSARGPILKVTNFVGGIVHLFEAFPARLATAGGDVFSGLEAKLGTIPAKLVSGAVNLGLVIVKAVAQGIASAPGAITSALVGQLPGPLRSAARKALGLGGDVVGAVTSLPSSTVKAGGQIFHLGGQLANGTGPFGLATGGYVASSGWAIVGERGPELAHLPGGSTVYDHRQSSRRMPAMAVAPGRDANFIAVLELDGKEIQRSVFRVERALQEAL